MSACRPVGLSACRPVDLSACRPVGLSACRPVGLSACRPVSLTAWYRDNWRYSSHCCERRRFFTLVFNSAMLTLLYSSYSGFSHAPTFSRGQPVSSVSRRKAFNAAQCSFTFCNMFHRSEISSKNWRNLCRHLIIIYCFQFHAKSLVDPHHEMLRHFRIMRFV